MEKLLVVCGPTATGKTKLALHLASSIGRSAFGRKLIIGELISADSRQVYKGMDIGTGKDLPEDSKFEIRNSKLGGSYDIAGTRVWGYDLVSPKEEFSVGKYLRIAGMAIKDIWIRERLPILVGGTGLYIKGVVDGIPTAAIPKNVALRESLKEKGARELFEILAQVDPIKAASMNVSDKKNPRRLVRAIEVAEYEVRVRDRARKLKPIPKDVLFIGLTAPKDFLFKRIKTRVEERIKQGLEEEIIKLLASGVSWESQAMDSLGYKQWKEYFKNRDGNIEMVIEKWEKDEQNYAKRQITWFKKDKRINWFEITKPNWEKGMEKLVQKWYKTE